MAGCADQYRVWQLAEYARRPLINYVTCELHRGMHHWRDWVAWTKEKEGWRENCAIESQGEQGERGIYRQNQFNPFMLNCLAMAERSALLHLSYTFLFVWRVLSASDIHIQLYCALK